MRLIGILLGLVLLAGCGNSNEVVAPTTTAPAPKLRVVATTTQIADFVKEIAGDQVDLDVIMQPGQVVSTYKPLPDDITKLARADVILRSGVGLDSWLEAAIEPEKRGVVRDTSNGVRIENRTNNGNNEPDPFYWTSPTNARIAVANVANALSERDATRADLFRTNERAYSAQLDGLRRDTERILSSRSQRKLVTARNDFGYYARDFQLDYVGSVEGVPRDQLVSDIRKEGVRVIVLSSVGSAAGSYGLATAAGIRVSGGSDVLYAESLGNAGTKEGTYIGSMRSNADVLVVSLD